MLVRTRRTIGTLALGNGQWRSGRELHTDWRNALNGESTTLVSSFTRFYDGTTTINSDDTTNVSTSLMHYKA